MQLSTMKKSNRYIFEFWKLCKALLLSIHRSLERINTRNFLAPSRARLELQLTCIIYGTVLHSLCYDHTNFIRTRLFVLKQLPSHVRDLINTLTPGLTTWRIRAYLLGTYSISKLTLKEALPGPREI